MSAKNYGKEGFWPFDDWFPEDPEGPGDTKPTPSLGDVSHYSSTKNYPSFTGAPIGRRLKSEEQPPAVKRSTGKKSSSND